MNLYERKTITHESPEEQIKNEQQRRESRNQKWQEFLSRAQDLESLSDEEFKQMFNKFMDTWLKIMPKEDTKEVFDRISIERERREKQEN